jgi:hypothetical protein
MPAFIRGLDHVLIAAKDLDGAASQWRRLGFAVTPPGRHVGRTTGNYCIMFPEDYVELIGIVDETATASVSDAFIRARGNGLFAAAISPVSAEEAHASVIAAGIEAGPLRPLHRAVERPDGAADLYFTNFELAAEATPEFRFFFCHHLSPEAMRHPQWLNHENGVVGVDGITVVSRDPATLHGTYGRLFGQGNLTTTDDILTLHVGNQHVMFVSDMTFRDLHPEFELSDEESIPYGAAVSFKVMDVDRTAGYFDRNDIPYHPSGETLLVAPEEATDVLLEFKNATLR